LGPSAFYRSIIVSAELASNLALNPQTSDMIKNIIEAIISSEISIMLVKVLQRKCVIHPANRTYRSRLTQT